MRTRPHKDFFHIEYILSNLLKLVNKEIAPAFGEGCLCFVFVICHQSGVVFGSVYGEAAGAGKDAGFTTVPRAFRFD